MQYRADANGPAAGDQTPAITEGLDTGTWRELAAVVVTMRSGALIASIVVIAAVAVLVMTSGGSQTSPARHPAGLATRTSSAARPHGAREDCSTRSGANFPGAFTSSRNLVVGPLVLIGGAFTSAGTVRRFGGNKFPLLVKDGYTVTVHIPHRAGVRAGLAYGLLPRGEVTLRETQRTITFAACGRGKPSGNNADGVPITFWSGFVLKRRPACVPLDVYVDGEPSPRHAGLGLGRRCHRRAAGPATPAGA
jgi:hypothetical protein